MPMHESLVELTHIAPVCDSPATAKGLIAESHELFRNAMAHGSDAGELVGWYCDVLAGLLTSPAVAALTGGTALSPTGALGRGEALPNSALAWLTPEGGDSQALSDLLATVGISGTAQSPTSVLLIDAGLHTPAGPDPDLLARAVRHRPPHLDAIGGLPDRSVLVQVRPTLLLPVADVARWAAGTEAAGVRRTPERLRVGAESGLLDQEERQSLERAWRTGITLEARRWLDRVGDVEPALHELSGVDRSAYGDAARTVAAVIRSLAARHGLALTGDTGLAGDVEDERDTIMIDKEWN